MEFLLHNIPNDYSYKKHYLDTHSSKVETLILGSSHAFTGINPELFSSNTFNAGKELQTLDIDSKIFHRYKTKFRNLRTIVLTISYPSLWGSIERIQLRSPDIANKFHHYYEFELPNKHIADYFLVTSFNSRKNLKKIFSYYLKNNKNTIKCTSLGWMPKLTKKGTNNQDLTLSGKTQTKWHNIPNLHAEGNQKCFQKNKLIIEDILIWAKAHHVNIILITLPAHQSYREHTNPEQFEITVQTANDFASEYENCMYLNFFSDQHFNTEDFFDAGHLNPKGAEKLSRILNNVIESNQP